MHPHVQGSTNDALIRCIEECYECASVCIACADACLGEDMVQQLTQCIRLNLDCADVCAATGSVATRRTGSDEEIVRLMLQACTAACRACGDECERHAGHHEHCRICAQVLPPLRGGLPGGPSERDCLSAIARNLLLDAAPLGRRLRHESSMQPTGTAGKSGSD